MSFPLSPDPVSNRPVQTDPALAGRTDSTQPGNALAESWKATLAQSKPLFALRVLFNLTIVGAVIDAVATTVSHKVGKLGQNAQPVAPSRQSNPAGESTPAPGAIRRQAADLGRAITSMRSKPLEAGMQTDLAASVRALTRPGGGFAPKAVWDGMKSYRANLGRYAGLNTLSPKYSIILCPLVTTGKVTLLFISCCAFFLKLIFFLNCPLLQGGSLYFFSIFCKYTPSNANTQPQISLNYKNTGAFVVNNFNLPNLH